MVEFNSRPIQNKTLFNPPSILQEPLSPKKSAPHSLENPEFFKDLPNFKKSDRSDSSSEEFLAFFPILSSAAMIGGNIAFNPRPINIFDPNFGCDRSDAFQKGLERLSHPYAWTNNA